MPSSCSGFVLFSHRLSLLPPALPAPRHALLTPSHYVAPPNSSRLLGLVSYFPPLELQRSPFLPCGALLWNLSFALRALVPLALFHFQALKFFLQATQSWIGPLPDPYYLVSMCPFSVCPPPRLCLFSSLLSVFPLRRACILRVPCGRKSVWYRPGPLNGLTAKIWPFGRSDWPSWHDY